VLRIGRGTNRGVSCRPHRLLGPRGLRHDVGRNLGEPTNAHQVHALPSRNVCARGRDLLYSTRIQEELIDEQFRPPHLSSWLAFDFSNLKRFQCIFSFNPAAWGYFDHAEIVGQHCESLDSLLDEMNICHIITTNPRSQIYFQLREYLTHADNLRAEILESFHHFVDFNLEEVRSLNPRSVLTSGSGNVYDV
jgi:hypothetical protein